MATDQLTLIPVEEFPALKDQLKHHFPRHLVGFSVIETLLEWHKTFGTIDPVQVYTLNKDWRHDGLFLMRFHNYLYVHSMAHDNDRIKRALKLWDWTQPWTINFEHHHSHADFVIHRILKEFHVTYKKMDFDIIHCSPEVLHGVAQKYPVPDMMTLKKLSVDDVPTIMKVPHLVQDAELIKILIERNASYGLYDKATSELMAWCMVSIEQGLLGMHVMDGVKDRGFENVLAAALAQDRVAMGKGTNAIVEFHGKYFTDILYDGQHVGKCVLVHTEGVKN